MRKFYKCNRCGNLLTPILDSGLTPVCCGEQMTVLTANTVDAAKEKHVPVIERDGQKISVAVGSVAHPMTEEHYIQFIAIEQASKVQIVTLSSSDEPTAKFVVCDPDAPVTAYEFCNLHGLWSAEG